MLRSLLHKKPLLLFLITALALVLMCASRVLADDENVDSTAASPGECSKYGDENIAWEPESSQRTTSVFSLFRASLDSAEPSSFDPRTTETYLPPVRSQGAYGTCWAFSAIADAEICGLKSNILTTSAADTNLSEWHLDYFARHPSTDPLGFITGDYNAAGAYLVGGNPFVATMTMACWRGPADESETSSQYESISKTATLADQYAYDDELHLENAYWLAAATSTDRENIKNMISKYGAATLCFYLYDGSDVNKVNYLYISGDKATACYYQGCNTSTNHEVTIVGWDDNYPASNFAKSPSGAAPGSDGAWLCRNSWGNTWGDGGYFWISYYDASVVANGCTVYDFGSADNYTNNYQYDGCTIPSLRTLGTSGGSVYYANVFTAKANTEGGEALEAASTYTYFNGVPYTVTVYTDLKDASDPDSGTLAYTGEGTFDYSGFHTVPIDPVALWEGETFAVVFKVEASSSGNLGVPTCYTTTASDWDSVNDVQAGQSFTSTDGSAWSDSSTSLASNPANVRIKAYTDNIEQVNVTYDACGGSLDISTGKLPFGIACGDLPTPTRDGYVFQGWFTKETDGTEITSDTVLKSLSDLTLYAHWLRSWTDGQFTDVSTTNWYYPNVKYCWQHSLFIGLTDTLFGTTQSATRGQVVTVLYRLAGSPAVTGSSTFDDVSPDAYYADAVTWAKANTIAKGSDDDGNGIYSFRPYANITRQDFLCLLYRYAAWSDVDVTGYENTSLSSFSDSGSVPDYAIPAEKWSVGTGLQLGSGGNLFPNSTISRTEVAAFLSRYDQDF